MHDEDDHIFFEEIKGYTRPIVGRTQAFALFVFVKAIEASVFVAMFKVWGVIA